VNVHSVKDILYGTLGDALKYNIPLKPFTSFKIGGPAKYFIEAHSTTEIIRAVKVARDTGEEFFILGGGSNILFDDDGFDGLVIRDLTDKFTVNGTIVSALSGAVVDKMVDVVVEKGLGGMEYAAGIKGTIGGAVYGNAGAFGHAINEILRSAVILTSENRLAVVDNDYFKFSYRKSKLSDCGEIVLSVKLELRNEEKDKLTEIVNERRKFRQERHPVEMGSAGSVFKNIRSLENPADVIPAGKLLEEAGMRGMVVGDAAVFEKHCNIIVNKGNANSKDVKKLVEIMKKAVFDKFGIDLQREILYIEQSG
jgi:UDP-N-acetylmuramate dehydrogenase